jgi:diguanylate cyclase (GGDEF)-like protein
MLLIVGAAVLDCLSLVPLHPQAAGLLVGLNAAVGLIAASAYAAIATRARRHPEPLVIVALVAVEAATLATGLLQPDLGLVTRGYLLLLPTIVALVIPWATRIHASWLVLHVAAVIAYTIHAPSASLGGGSQGDMLMLLAVATLVSQMGHLAALHARILSFVQIERIRALNRQAYRDEVRLDRLNRILEQTARTDELTGLPNRLSLKLDLGVARARIARHGEHYALLMLDLDRFKGINDGLGHVAGDTVLRTVAASLRHVVRAEDGVYRYGGEEFVILIRTTQPPDGLMAAERIRCAVEELAVGHPANPPHGRVTASIGLASIGPADLSAEDGAWFARADAALYRAKAGGRNRCEAEVTPADVARYGATRAASDSAVGGPAPASGLASRRPVASGPPRGRLS